ncbi:hypothetical protein [Lunatibacter salilacus]|uniref:hypothetical protein n=1 Tax=Lunatibacter salilacus TaxID=2483804 RepID=UPI001F2ECD82|nr:hypothetical protein [Lunatibacter salilacus]
MGISPSPVLKVDLLCTGIPDALYKVNVPLSEFESFVDHISEDSGVNFMEKSHELGHNIIFGALEYAEELNMKYPKSFEG